MSELEDQARKLLPLTEATYYVLISLVEPRHGYGIMQNVAVLSEGKVRIGPGTLYGALTNLLKQGLIERAGELETEGERRKVYALTKLGRAVVLLECERLETLARIGREAADKLREEGKESSS
jgi:DNA-binding PadR family transcriptional regulator